MKLTRCNTDTCTPSTVSRLPNLDAWLTSPFAGFSALNPFFDFGRLFASPEARLAADVFEDDSNLYTRFEVPGVKKDDVKVEVVDRKLTVSVSRKDTSADGERSFALTRSLSIPDLVAEDQISARLEDGILTVTLPKQEQQKPRTIEIL